LSEVWLTRSDPSVGVPIVAVPAVTVPPDGRMSPASAEDDGLNGRNGTKTANKARRAIRCLAHIASSTCPARLRRGHEEIVYQSMLLALLTLIN
jgi:hypothetical protein